MLAALVCVLGVALVVQTLRLSWRTSLPARRLASARVRGADGELRAMPLLESLGFTLIGQQVAGRYELSVDGERIAFDLRADYLVSQDGRSYVAEVKTGKHAPRLETAATRRQLLEYGIAFDVDGVLLVDVDAAEVRLVEVPSRARSEESSSHIRGNMVWLVAGLLAGISIAVWLSGLRAHE